MHHPIKILPEAFVADAERVARFQREAKVLASLNHPHIAAIYGLDDPDGVRLILIRFCHTLYQQATSSSYLLLAWQLRSSLLQDCRAAENDRTRSLFLASRTSARDKA